MTAWPGLDFADGLPGALPNDTGAGLFPGLNGVGEAGTDGALDLAIRVAAPSKAEGGDNFVLCINDSFAGDEVIVTASLCKRR